VIVLIGFNVLGGDDDDNGTDNSVVIPTSAAPGSGSDASGTPEGDTASDVTAASPESGSSDTGFFIGAADAPVTIIEWADYQCPFCGDFAREIKPQLIQDYVNTGLVRFEFRDFQFLGDESTDAAEAARCASDQGKFWEYHDTLFANQDGENEGAFSTERLTEMAEGLGLDTTVFDNCLARNTHEAAVQSSTDQAADEGVNQTPTLSINGEKLVGLGSYDELRDRIEAALGNE
jgi:protein-disulfide isomerase